ncbi:ORF6N domain-containing protein [Clostridium estertheticum]|uniref:ORF6N domain-containing protein n=1 Tax=Clostridium estertheticum TaxID=238834 RepID=UPI001C0C7B76|nr:ORF6N domain-containing protein [Clostridium estertheticum]MBU3176300.1 ORF6N domain-containing protein [Clostridium estertheticum]
MDGTAILGFKRQRILTTVQLAEVYETTINSIKKNFNSNKDRFMSGKHYYLLKGEELREFKR